MPGIKNQGNYHQTLASLEQILYILIMNPIAALSKKLLIITLFAAAAFFISSCAGIDLLQVETVQNKAIALKGYCEDNNIKSDNTIKAITHFFDGMGLIGREEVEEALVEFDLAVLNYQIAIQEHTLMQSRRQIKQADQELEEARKKLKIYKDYFKSLKVPIVESTL